MTISLKSDDHASEEQTTVATCPAGLAKSLAPEDVRVGDHVAVLHDVCELPSFFWCNDAALASREEIVRLMFTPCDSGEPLEVRAVCLPFVMVKPVKGKVRSLDVRRSRLARLAPEYAEAWKLARKRRKK